MAKKINVPIYNIKPANEILDILTGNSDICIINPWFTIPGVTNPDFNTFLKLSEIGTKYKGTKIDSPKIAYKCGNDFRTDIIFTEDRGESACTTRLRFYQLYQTELEDYKTKFKPLQKITATKGTLKPENKGIITECIINYQLAQAFELCLLLKMLNIKNIKPESTDDNLTYESLLKTIIDELKIDSTDSKYTKIIEDMETKLESYLEFVKKPEETDKRYMVTYSESIDKDDIEIKIDDLFKVISELLSYKYLILKKKQANKSELTNSEKNFISYNKILSSINYKPVSGACYPKYYKKEIKDNIVEGTSVYTDYSFNNGDKSQTRHRSKFTKGELVKMTPEDHARIANQPIEAKIYLRIDFDFRCYPTSKEKAPSTVRYVVTDIQYKMSTDTASNVDVDKGIDIGMDDDITYVNEDEIENDDI